MNAILHISDSVRSNLGRLITPFLISACAWIMACAPGTPCRAAQSPLLTSCAADLEHITGGKIEIHTGPLLSGDSSLPLVCRTLDEAFREAAADPETRERLDRIIHVIDIEGLFAGDEVHHVHLKNEVMTIQTLNTPDALFSLRPLIVEVLKKVAHLEAQREVH